MTAVTGHHHEQRTTTGSPAAETMRQQEGERWPWLPRPRGAAWLVLRQHRTTAWIALGLLAALLVELVWLRFTMAGYIDRHGLRDACDVSGADCAVERMAAVEHFRSVYGDLLHYSGLFLGYLPLLAGLFVAGPMVARELETGTYRMAWTQAVSPARWLAAKLAVPVVAVLGGVSLLTAARTWAWSVVPASLLPGERWHSVFDTIGPLPVARCLLAVAAGALVGLLVRRTVGAMAVTLVASGVLEWLIGTLRDSGLVAPVTELSKDMPGLILGPGDWVVERGLITPDGGRVPEPGCKVGITPEQCVTQHDALGWYLDYHPASHLWELQWAEAGLTAAAAVALAAAALAYVRRAYP
ncbi:hypothetical protein GCM10010218_29210 [Streptomyces mashuensis]|uniref:Uncharacterized protein n=1 Tax=Streptomyces mashuensis TaxID=33904 RepID=A0A919B310_9ACTN|nr:hypothetical protein [Streptomyces mashuensis]GHF46133.1 hypothetical protein GCM10010218_29210 [Streptomyces mashuensis]